MVARQILSAVASTLSICASLWLLCSLRRLPLHLRSKLLARQLWHLALADLWAYGVDVFADIHGLVQPYSSYFNPFCAVVLSYRIGMITGAFVEVHVAFSLLANTRRWNASLRCLSHILPSVWILGGAVGCVSIIVTYLQWAGLGKDSEDKCAAAYGGAVIKDIALISSGVVCVIVYVYLGWQSRDGGVQQSSRAFDRAGNLLVAYLISVTPKSIVQLLRTGPGQRRADSMVDLIVEPLYNLGGFINLVIYFLLNTKTRRMMRRSKEQHDLTPNREPRDRSQIASYSLTFGGTDVILVDTMHREAQQRVDTIHREAQQKMVEETESFFGCLDEEFTISSAASQP